MAQVAKETQYVEDELGIRRLVVAGQQVPPGIVVDVDTVEGDVRKAAAPVVDADASKASGTALRRDAGTSTENAEQLRQSARGGAKSAAKPKAS